MAIGIEEIRRIREAFERVVSAGGGEEALREFRNLSREQESIVRELMDLDESDWRRLLGTLGETDPERSDSSRSAKDGIESIQSDQANQPFRLSSQIQNVGVFPYLSLESGVPLLRFIFKTADGKTLLSDQDLEDSLWIGVAVLQSVERSVRAMIEDCGIAPDRIVWGHQFGARLELAEESTTLLRGLYGRRGGAEEDAGSSADDE